MFNLSNYIQPQLIKVNGSLCNASFLKNKNELLILGRETEYSFVNNFGNIIGWPFDSSMGTNENIYVKNDDKWIVKHKVFETTQTYKQKYYTYGENDFRLIFWNNKLYCNFVKESALNAEPGKAELFGVMHIGEITDDLCVNNKIEIKTDRKIEKNWQPIEDMPFTVIYEYKPFTLFNLKSNEFTNIDNDFANNYSGSSSVIKYKDNYLCICHSREYNETKEYMHYFVLFDKDLHLLKISKPFKFFGANIEFCVYLGIIENKLNILASINDQITYSFVLDDNIIDDIFNEKLKDNSTKENLYDDVFNDALENKNYLLAASLGTFSNNIDIIKKSLYFIKDLHISDFAKNYIQLILNKQINMHNSLMFSNKAKQNIGLFVLAFKPIDYNIPNMFTLLECGAALHNNHFSECLDNTGDNISNRNRIYCDTTGAYWIWKNVHTPIKGQIQYRRFMNIEPNNIEDLLKYYDIICGNPLNFGQLSLEQQLNGLDPNYLKTIKKIISEKYPEYVSSYEKYIEHGSILYYSPGFITTDKIYDSICEFCFDILFEFMHSYGFENEEILYNHTKEWCLENNQEYGEGKLRVPGHLFERLFTLYIFHNNLKIMNTGPYILKEKNMTL